MRIAICDDNKESVALVEEIIERTNIKDTEIDCFYSGDKLLDYLEKNKKFYYQIYMLDIEMPGINGIDVAKKIREVDKRAIIIFITSYADYVFNAFEVQPFRFVNKPVCYEKLEGVVQAAVNFIYTSKKYIFLSVNKAKVQVCCENIMYFEGDKRKINVYTLDENYSFYSKMSDVEKMVDNSWFVRIHVSYLVNMDYVKAIYLNEIVLTNECHLPISKNYCKSAKVEYMKHTKWRMGI